MSVMKTMNELEENKSIVTTGTSHLQLVRMIERKVIEKVNKLNAFASQSDQHRKLMVDQERKCNNLRREAATRAMEEADRIR
jgi:hypothetical protein